MAVEKLIRNGLVAVLYSPGFGAGWSTWCGSEHAYKMCVDKELAEAVDAGDYEKAAEIAERKYDAYTGGAYKLKIEWVKEGSAFMIEEYDGSESIIFSDDMMCA